MAKERNFDVKALPLLRLAKLATAAQVDNGGAAASVNGAAARVGGRGRHASSSGSAGCHHRRVDRAGLLFPLTLLVTYVLFLISLSDVSKPACALGGLRSRERSRSPDGKPATALTRPVTVVLAHLGAGQDEILTAEKGRRSLFRCYRGTGIMFGSGCVNKYRNDFLSKKNFLVVAWRELLFELHQMIEARGLKFTYLINCSEASKETQCRGKYEKRVYVDFEDAHDLDEKIGVFGPEEPMYGLTFGPELGQPLLHLCPEWRIVGNRDFTFSFSKPGSKPENYSCAGRCSLLLSIIRSRQIRISEVSGVWSGDFRPMRSSEIEQMSVTSSKETKAICTDTNQPFVLPKDQKFQITPQSVNVREYYRMFHF